LGVPPLAYNTQVNGEKPEKLDAKSNTTTLKSFRREAKALSRNVEKKKEEISKD